MAISTVYQERLTGFTPSLKLEVDHIMRNSRGSEVLRFLDSMYGIRSPLHVDCSTPIARYCANSAANLTVRHQIVRRAKTSHHNGACILTSNEHYQKLLAKNFSV
jgi:hypothetical protein